MSDLAGLLARVEGASGPNYALECAIFETLEMPTEWFGKPIVGRFLDGGGYSFATADGFRHLDCIRPPAYTASLDAALALVERVLPGWTWIMRSDETRGFFGRVASPDFDCVGWDAGGKTTWDVTAGHDAHAYAKTPALALLAAMLKALTATGVEGALHE